MTLSLLIGDDVLYLLFLFIYVFGLNVGLGMVLRVGAIIVLVDWFDFAASLEMMAVEYVTAVLGVLG